MDKISIYVGLELVFGPILKDYQLEGGTFSSGSKIWTTIWFLKISTRK